MKKMKPRRLSDLLKITELLGYGGGEGAVGLSTWGQAGTLATSAAITT